MMTVKTEFVWDTNDPLPMGKRVEEAFNRVQNFCPELLDTDQKKSHRAPELTSFNRVTNGEFDMNDIRRLHAYSLKVHEDIVTKYAGQTDPVAEGVLQAAKNVVEVMGETLSYVLDYPKIAG